MTGEYIPKPGPELNVYEGLWRVASPNGAELSGAQAVDFFRKSGVDIGLLRQIWGLSTPSATLNIHQFFSALRLITMVQNGDIPLSRDRLHSCASINYGPVANFPRFNDVQLSLPPVTAVPSVAAGIPPTAGVVGPYAITPEDHIKYFNLFKGYDTNGDGYLTGAEAVAVFSQSGLDQSVLRAIWELADDDKDNQLTSKEFCVAFHLILCIGKKRLPLPIVIPPELKSFLLNAPPIPPTLPPVVAAVPVIPVPTPVVPIPTPVTSLPIHSTPVATTTVDSGGLAIPSPRGLNDATAGSSSTVKRPPQPTKEYIVQGLSDAEEVELTQTVSSIRDISRRALQAGDTAVESNITNSSSLRLVMQRLNQEKIALSAAVESAEASANESATKLATVVEEVKKLQDEVTELRQQLDQKKGTDHHNQSQVHEQLLLKQNLVNQITQIRSEISTINGDISSTSIDVGKSEGLRAEVEEKSSSLDQEKTSLQNDIKTATNELTVLQQILASLHGDKDGRLQTLSKLQAQKTVSQTALQRERNATEKKETEILELKQEKQNIQEEKTKIVNEIADKTKNGAKLEIITPDRPAVSITNTSNASSTTTTTTTTASSKVTSAPAVSTTTATASTTTSTTSDKKMIPSLGSIPTSPPPSQVTSRDEYIVQSITTPRSNSPSKKSQNNTPSALMESIQPTSTTTTTTSAAPVTDATKPTPPPPTAAAATTTTTPSTTTISTKKGNDGFDSFGVTDPFSDAVAITSFDNAFTASSPNSKLTYDEIYIKEVDEKGSDDSDKHDVKNGDTTHTSSTNKLPVPESGVNPLFEKKSSITNVLALEPPPVSPLNSRAPSFTAAQWKTMRSPSINAGGGGGGGSGAAGMMSPMSERSSYSIDPFDPFAVARRNSLIEDKNKAITTDTTKPPVPTTSTTTTTAPTTTTTKADDGFGSSTGFDSNPFEDVPSGTKTADSAFSADFGASSFPTDFGTGTGSSANTTKPISSKDDGFGSSSSGFDANPFEDPSPSSIGKNDGFDSFASTGFDDPFSNSGGTKPASTSSGFDDWK